MFGSTKKSRTCFKPKPSAGFFLKWSMTNESPAYFSEAPTVPPDSQVYPRTSKGTAAGRNCSPAALEIEDFPTYFARFPSGNGENGSIMIMFMALSTKAKHSPAKYGGEQVRGELALQWYSSMQLKDKSCRLGGLNLSKLRTPENRSNWLRWISTVPTSDKACDKMSRSKRKTSLRPMIFQGAVRFREHEYSNYPEKQVRDD